MLQYSSSIIAASAISLAYKNKAILEQKTHEQDRSVECFIIATLGFKESEVLFCMKEL